MRFDDKIYLKANTVVYDDDLDVVESGDYSFIGKCKILPNTSARQMVGNDGKTYTYSQSAFIKNPTSTPKEGDMVKLYNNTAKTTVEYRVAGVCVYPKKYVKIFV